MQLYKKIIFVIIIFTTCNKYKRLRREKMTSIQSSSCPATTAQQTTSTTTTGSPQTSSPSQGHRVVHILERPETLSHVLAATMTLVAQTNIAATTATMPEAPKPVKQLVSNEKKVFSLVTLDLDFNKIINNEEKLPSATARATTSKSRLPSSHRNSCTRLAQSPDIDPFL
jgi:hypothetical protein